MKIPTLYISESSIAGRGVFSTEDIPAGSVIEICPVILIPPDQIKSIESTELFDYYFQWGEDEKSCAITLGYGSLYNHSFSPNARYYTDFESDTLDVIALLDISAGEEITFNYNGEPDDMEPVWFMER
ncbi:MAG: SET domain-containing protein [Polaribacter sp.]|jgi:SET domain-containing protein